MSVAEHPELFKAEWIAEPARLKTLARRAKYNDLFTAEIAAWCAEIHEHLRDLEAEVGVQLILMGGNGAYVIPVELRLGHGRATSNEVKAEFHFERELPPAETVLGSLGPAGVPISARLPELPYQLVLKLMALATPPVGIDEDRRADAVPRQLYDLDLLLAALREERQWQTMADYCRRRYERECAHWSIPVAAYSRGGCAQRVRDCAVGVCGSAAYARVHRGTVARADPGEPPGERT